MGKNIFENLIENNEFPIIFMGSGISKRYLLNSPTWRGLLEKLWEKAFKDNSFYSRLNQIRRTIQEKEIDKKEQDFYLNIEIASEIEKKFIEDFDLNKIEIEGLTPQKVFEEEINPFKYYLAKQFQRIETNEVFRKEQEEFKKMLNKAKIILTTNYDNFIEKIYEDDEKKINIYIGQKGLFKPNLGYCELFKIHGCCTDEKTLILTKDDYKSIERNLSLVSAKITSELLLSPIIFIGYSLSDTNIRKIIQNFVDSLNEKEKKELEERIIFIEWKENQSALKISSTSEFGIRITLVETDNYKKIYNEISKIDQGVSPWEISKYKSLIKKIIINQRQDITSDTILIEAKKLEEICSDDIKDKKIVVSITEGVEIMPDEKSYLKTILDDRSYNDIINKLKFIAMSTKGSIGNFPIFKYLNKLEILNTEDLTEKEQIKLEAVYNKQIANIKTLKSKKSKKSTCSTITEIRSKLIELNKETRLHAEIVSNFDNLDIIEVKEFLFEELESENFEFTTDLRRLFLLYDNKVHNK